MEVVGRILRRQSSGIKTAIMTRELTLIIFGIYATRLFVFGQEPIQIKVVESGQQVTAINWQALLPQMDSVVMESFKGTRILSAKPITFTAKVKGGQLSENITCIVEYSERITPTTDLVWKKRIVAFTRDPYDFNGEWNLYVGPNWEQGWIELKIGKDQKVEVDQLYQFLTKQLGECFWPKQADGSGNDWLLCQVYQAGFTEVTKQKYTQDTFQSGK